MKVLYQQMAHLPSEFRAHVLLVAKSLEPAQALHLRMAELARTFEPVHELAARFAELAEAFRFLPAWAGTAAMGNGRKKEIILSHVSG
jgi:hypothetical protein